MGKHKYKMSMEHKMKIGFANKGENHGLWKGVNVGYKGLHNWIRRNYGKPTFCEKCGVDNKRIEWANINKTYQRNRDDWKKLCKTCHYSLDFGELGNPNAKLTKEQINEIKITPKIYGIIKKLATKYQVERHTISRYF